VHLYQQLLQPVMEVSLNTCLGPLEAFTRSVLGPRRPQVMYLPDYFEALARINETSAGDLVPVVHDDPDADAEEEPATFSEEQHQAVDALLATATAQGVRLSELLGSARLPGPGTGPASDTDALLTMRVQQLFRNVPVRQLAAGEPAVVALSDGTDLVDERFGGSDFLLVRTSPQRDTPSATDGALPPSEQLASDSCQESV
jgi:hypothetical protein